MNRSDLEGVDLGKGVVSHRGTKKKKEKQEVTREQIIEEYKQERKKLYGKYNNGEIGIYELKDKSGKLERKYTRKINKHIASIQEKRRTKHDSDGSPIIPKEQLESMHRTKAEFDKNAKKHHKEYESHIITGNKKDNRAEGVASYNEATGWMRVIFDQKPSREVLDSLKQRGFRYKPRSRAWSAKWTPEREDHAKTLVKNWNIVDVTPNWERKAERARELQNKHERASDDAYNRHRGILDAIPFGQPILVGHHSEKRHRSDLDKADRLMRKNIEEQEIADKYGSRAERLEEKARGENPVTIYNRIQRLEAEQRDFERRLERNPNNKHAKRWLEHTQTMLKNERKKYKDVGGIAADNISIKPGDRVQTRWGPATIRTISKKSARIAFDSGNTGIYGLSSDSKIPVTDIKGKLPFKEDFVFNKIKNKSHLEPFVGKKVTLIAERHSHHGCGMWGTSRYDTKGTLIKEGDSLFFVPKGKQEKQPVAVGKLNLTRADKIESPLHVQEIRATWGVD